MKLQKQKFLHDPANGVYGDCYRTALACLLDMNRDDVPHFANTMEPHDWSNEVQPKFDAWLLEQGFVEVSLPFDSDADGVLACQAKLNPRLYYMLSGRSRTGVNHVVICRGGEIVWDSSLTDSGIVGRCDDGYHWIAFLVPASQTDRGSH